LNPAAPRLSIVVPCYNARLTAAAEAAIGDGYEIVLVNDGSRDGSWTIMQKLAAADPHVFAIDLSRNHGHQLALTAGLDLCRGEVILIIDADLQDPPELLGPMLQLMQIEGADVVYGVRSSRAGETRFKRATAHAFYRLLSRLTDVDIPLDAGDFRLMSRRALDVLLAMPEQARFIRGMVAWIGFKQVPIAYARDERLSGETNYPLSKMLRFALDALTGFSSAPLKLASHAGLLLSLGSVATMIYIFASWLSGASVQGWTSLMLVVVALGAVQMFVLALMGEYIGRLYSQAKQRPLYIVQEITGARAAGRLGIVASAVGPVAVKEKSDQRRQDNVRNDGPPGGSGHPLDQ
jgi:glycosyltransferase involved in cell wall biosynthesis